MYRLINGEGDRLGGLIVDMFDDVCVVQSSAIWVEKHSGIVSSSLRAVLGSSVKLIWRRAEARLLQDGFDESGSLPAPPSSDIIEKDIGIYTFHHHYIYLYMFYHSIYINNLVYVSTVVLENGLKYHVSPEDGTYQHVYS